MVEAGPRKRKTAADDKKAGGGGSGSDNGGKSKEETKRLLAGRYNPRKSDKGAWLTHSNLAKTVIGAGAIIYMVYTKMNEKHGYLNLARVDEVLQSKRYQQFLCSPSYKTEIEALEPACVPNQCGRFVLDDLVTEAEAHQLLTIAKKGLSKGGGAGGASILDLHSGALSHGEQFINVYKVHPNLFTRKDFDTYNDVKNRVRDTIAEHFNLDASRLYLTYPTFFSELTSLPPTTAHDEYWHDHIDKETYPSFHYTALLYLTHYKRDFTGGRFIFIDSHKKVNRTVEPKEGRLSVFTSGHENRHRVEEVTGGTRYALTLGFTCDPSKKILDPGTELDLQG